MKFLPFIAVAMLAVLPAALLGAPSPAPDPGVSGSKKRVVMRADDPPGTWVKVGPGRRSIVNADNPRYRRQGEVALREQIARIQKGKAANAGRSAAAKANTVTKSGVSKK